MSVEFRKKYAKVMGKTRSFLTPRLRGVMAVDVEDLKVLDRSNRSISKKIKSTQNLIKQAM